jgi:pantoate--beta-alanine ligase
MLILNSPQVVQETALRWKRESKVGLVPTMGALHEGHLQLVRLAKTYSQRVIVSIFVNPLQFGPTEDLDKYPRTLEEDVAKLEALDVDLLFAPSPKDFYPPGFSTRVRVNDLSSVLCGQSRPGHFEGVATVCLKLFQTTQADFAVYGEKDFQQLRVLQQMTADLNLPLSLLPHPIVREADGLAMSSRNRYLSTQDRKRALAIPRSLKAAASQARTNRDLPVSHFVQLTRDALAGEHLEIDYVELVREQDLRSASPETLLREVKNPRLFIAVRAGSTRLIDNLSLAEESS